MITDSYSYLHASIVSIDVGGNTLLLQKIKNQSEFIVENGTLLKTASNTIRVICGWKLRMETFYINYIHVRHTFKCQEG